MNDARPGIFASVAQGVYAGTLLILLLISLAFAVGTVTALVVEAVEFGWSTGEGLTS